MLKKEEVLEKIKSKMGKTQKISDRTILETAETLLSFATDETTLEDFVEKIYPALDSANRNHIAEVANEIKSYKEANPTPAPTQTAAPTTTTTRTPDEKLLEQLATLSQQVQAITSEKTIETNKTKFIAGLKQKGVTDDKFLAELMNFITIGSDTNVEEAIEKGTTFYNTVKANGNPPTPQGGGGDPKKDDDFGDIVEKRSN